MFRNRCSVLMIKFQCPDHTFDIIGMNRLCTRRINLAKTLMKILGTFFFCQLFQFGTVGIFLLRLCKINVSCYCLNIKSSSADKNRYFSFCIDCFHGSFCHLLKFHNMKFLFRFKYIHQIMLYSLHFLRTDLRRTDIHFFIYLHGIRRNNFPVHRLCK